MSASKYSVRQILLHWGIAALVAVLLALAGDMTEAFDQMTRNIATGNTWTFGAIVHAVLGAAIGLLMFWRLMLRRTTPMPPPAGHGLAGALDRAVHWLLYVLLIGMPVVGALAWYIPSAPLAALHRLSGELLLALIVLHIAATLYHHLIVGDKSVLHRMMPR